MNDIENIKSRIDKWLNNELPEPMCIKSGKYSVLATAEDTFEIGINKLYFISVGKLAEDTYEVFTLHYNVKTKKTHDDWGNIPFDEDHLCQHKCFTSWKRAFNYALRYAEKQETPKDVNEIW